MNQLASLQSRKYLVTPSGKRYFNEVHFTESAPRYDIATMGMSIAQDAAWKRHLISLLPPLERPMCVDLACGTGDLTFALAKRYPAALVTGIDLTDAMLNIARRRNSFPQIHFVRGDMNELDIESGSVDIVTGGYALRNSPELGRSLREISRILKPGGTAAFLDFCKPHSPVLQFLEYWLLKIWCGLWGLMLHGTGKVHGYISESLRTYPPRAELHGLFRAHGFEILASKPFFLGIIEVTLLRKSQPHC